MDPKAKNISAAAARLRDSGGGSECDESASQTPFVATVSLTDPEDPKFQEEENAAKDVTFTGEKRASLVTRMSYLWNSYPTYMLRQTRGWRF